MMEFIYKGSLISAQALFSLRALLCIAEGTYLPLNIVTAFSTLFLTSLLISLEGSVTQSGE